MEFKISKDLLDELEILIQENKEKEVLDLLQDIHFADIAEIMGEMQSHEAIYIFNAFSKDFFVTISLGLMFFSIKLITALPLSIP